MDFRSAYNLANSAIVHFLFKAYDYNSNRLNYALATEDPKLIDEAFDKFLKMRMMSDSQRADILSRAFDYYMSIDDRPKIDYYYKRLMNVGDEALTREIDCVYNTYFQGGYVYLQYKLDQIKDMKPKYRGTHEFYISKMYENKGDMKNAKKYLDMAIKHTNMLADESVLVKKTQNLVTKRNTSAKSKEPKSSPTDSKDYIEEEV